MSNTIISAGRIFTGEAWLNEHSVIIENGIIKDVISSEQLQTAAGRSAEILIPAFIDLQIYGAYGKLLAVYPEADSLHKLYAYCIEGGAAHFLPTIATNTKDVFLKSIDAVREYWEEGGKGCLGIHLEGPWINKHKRGAHIEEEIHSPSLDEVKELLGYGKGVIRMITLAPEVCDRSVVEYILQQGIVISAGHSNASYEEANMGFQSGITAVTHLYNAMSGLQHRQVGLVGATFLHPSVRASIIADGHHVDYTAIRIAKKQMQDRLFLITDAVTETSTGAYPHYPVGDKYEASGILSGSMITMHKAVLNLIDKAGIEKEEAIRMGCVYPAKVIGLDNKLGMIKKGYQSHILVTDKNLNKVETIS